MSRFLETRFQQDDSTESRCLSDQLPHENQLYVWAAEEDSAAGDLRSDAVPLDEGGRRRQPGDAILLLRPGTGQRTGAHRVGGQPLRATDR